MDKQDLEHLAEYGNYKYHLESLLAMVQDPDLKETLQCRLQSVDNCIGLINRKK